MQKLDKETHADSQKQLCLELQFTFLDRKALFCQSFVGACGFHGNRLDIYNDVELRFSTRLEILRSTPGHGGHAHTVYPSLQDTTLI